MKYTCIMGSHNPREEWIHRALDSAYGLFDEVIIVDDGSQPAIKECIGNRVGETLIRHETNKGFYEAKNTAISNSSGDIIATLDDDDYFNREGVAKLKQFIEQNPESDVYHFKLQMFNTDSGIYGGGAEPKNLTSFNSIPGISWYKKQMWTDLGGFTYPLAEDWDFWLRAFRNNKRFAFFDNIVYNFNKRTDSVSSRWTGAMFDKIRYEILTRNGVT